MSPEPFPEVFTADEVARAAGVSRAAVVQGMAGSGVLPVRGTRYLAAADALRLARALRANTTTVPQPAGLFSLATRVERSAARADQRRVPTLASLGVHAAVAALLLWVSAGAPGRAESSAPIDDARMVFVVAPGPGGGGGGGGNRNPLPAPKLERRGPQRIRVSVPKATPDPVLTTARAEEPPKPKPVATPIEPKPIERPPDPLPSRILVAPVVDTSASARDREGVIERPRGDATSQGAGIGGGAGTGQGTGNGEGLGSGIGEGSGGGTGGGPFRPGSGIDPPRLIREVKADYTEDARRRGITGDVEMEIVIRRDGSVGDVTILRGLGAGLDQRAVNAVKQWRFSPARRKGEPVDVIVEVAVEFTLR